MTNRTETQVLADDLQAYLDTIKGLAVAFREDLALDGQRPGSTLGAAERDAILHGIVCTAKVAAEDLITLLDKLGVPA